MMTKFYCGLSNFLIHNFSCLSPPSPYLKLLVYPGPEDGWQRLQHQTLAVENVDQGNAGTEGGQRLWNTFWRAKNFSRIRAFRSSLSFPTKWIIWKTSLFCEKKSSGWQRTFVRNTSGRIIHKTSVWGKKWHWAKFGDLKSPAKHHFIIFWR